MGWPLFPSCRPSVPSVTSPQPATGATALDRTQLEGLRRGLELLALRAFGDRAVAEEIAQETLARAVVAAERGAKVETGKLAAFVAGIARHVITDRQRESGRLAPLSAADSIEAPDADPLARLLSDDEARAVRAALTSLGADDRELLRLCYFEGRSPDRHRDPTRRAAGTDSQAEVARAGPAAHGVGGRRRSRSGCRPDSRGAPPSRPSRRRPVTDQLTHQQADTAGVAARFVAGTLMPHEREAFEEHLLECAACQAEVELGLTLRASGVPQSPRRARLAWRAAGVLAAAAILLIVVMPRGGADAARLAALGEVVAAPVYLGIPVRADEREARFDAAMTAYRVGDYARALAGLDAVAEAVDAPPVHFFRGASALMLGADSVALVAFDALLAGAASPYHDEARYYRAKALLRTGRAARALDDLRAITDPGLRAQAAALGDSIEAVGIR